MEQELPSTRWWIFNSAKHQELNVTKISIVAPLSAAELGPFAPFTFTYMRSQLLDPDSNAPLISVGATIRTDDAHAPAGLAVARIKEPRDAEHERTASVVSLYVAPEYRNRGVGAALMRGMLGKLHRRGVRRVSLHYSSGKPTTPALEALMKRHGWSAPFTVGVVCKWDWNAPVPLARSEELLAKGSTQLHDLQPFPWSELGQADQAALLQQEGSLYPPALSPFAVRPHPLAENSLGLRDPKGVAAWCIVRRAASDVLLYDALFVRPGAPRGTGTKLLLLALAEQFRVRQSIPYAMCALQGEAASMRRLLRRFDPYCISVVERRRSEHDLRHFEQGGGGSA